VLAAEALWQRLDDANTNTNTKAFYAPYLAVLPPPPPPQSSIPDDDGDGHGGSVPTPLTTTDFFTEAELAMLGWGPIQV
jgi:hypothetical protein